LKVWTVVPDEQSIRTAQDVAIEVQKDERLTGGVSKFGDACEILALVTDPTKWADPVLLR
jgi:hypothetical protein